MKKKIISFIFLGFLMFFKSQIVNIPDTDFKAYLISNSEINLNKDNEIQISEAIAFKGKIFLYDNNTSDLTGIEAFVNITELFCNTRKLTNLDVSKNLKLKYLNCVGNQLKSLDLSQNTALEILYCGYNQLTTLDMSKNTALTILSCENNQFVSLDLSGNKVLKHLICSNNQLTSLDIRSTSLKELICKNNKFTNLDVTLCQALESIDCSYNLLTQLDVSKNYNLTVLNVGNNKLTDIDLSTKSLYFNSLYCQNNQLKSLNIKNGFNTRIDNMYASGNPSLTCIQVDNPVNAASYRRWEKDATANYSKDCLLSVTDTEKPTIKIYPNPAKNNLNFSEEISDIKISDLSGKVVKQVSNLGKSINVSKLVKGNYIITATTKTGETINKKFIKE